MIRIVKIIGKLIVGIIISIVIYTEYLDDMEEDRIIQEEKFAQEMGEQAALQAMKLDYPGESTLQRTLPNFEYLGLTKQDEILTLTYIPREDVLKGAYITFDSSATGDFIGGYTDIKIVPLKNGTAKYGINGPLATLIWKKGSTNYELTYHFYYEDNVEEKLVEIANSISK